MKLRAGCEITVQADEDCPSVAILRPRSGQAQWLSSESYLFEPWDGPWREGFERTFRPQLVTRPRNGVAATR